MSKEQLSLFSEAAYNIRHLKQSFEQRSTDILVDKSLISSIQDTLPQINPYFHNNEKATSITPLASGFFFSTYRFETSKGEWVAKIGLPESPMKGYPSPSSLEFKEWYNRCLTIQQDYFSTELPQLIPTPQIAHYVSGDARDTTVILQPFIDGLTPLRKIAELSNNERKVVRQELYTFDTIVKTMQRECGLTPDMLRAKDHFGIVPREDGHHLVLLDNGFFDDTLPARGMNTLNRTTYSMRMLLEKSKYRK